MKVVFLAAGAGGMICGSCLRDNRLAAALIAKGHNVVLMPLYTPLRTDEPDVSRGGVHFGGIHIYLKQKWPWVRRLPNWTTNWLNQRWVLRGVGRLAARTEAHTVGDLAVSVLRGPRGPFGAELNALIADLRTLRPDAVVLPNLMFLGAAEPIRTSLGVPVLCTLSGEDIFLDALPEPFGRLCFELIRDAANSINAFVGVTRYYLKHCVHHFQLPPERCHHVPLGVRVDHTSTRPPEDPARPMVVGYLARICKEKGLAQLCEAFVELHRRQVPCRLHIAGYRAPAEKAYLDHCIDTLGPVRGAAAFRDFGEPPDFREKMRFLAGLDVFSVPTIYPEAKGLSILEAMSCKVPVVQPAHGSFPEMIDDTGGGLLFPPGRADALADQLQLLYENAEARRSLGEAGYQTVRSKYSTEVMAESMWQLLQRVTSTSRLRPQETTLPV